jgi:uncharacterized protein YggE
MKILSMVLLISLSFLANANSSLPNNRHIAVEGAAQLTAIPDLAIISFDVRSTNATSLEAKQNIDERVNNFLAGLKDFGLDESDVSASSISTSQHYTFDEGQEKIEGFDASRSLEVTLKDIKKLSSFVDFALKLKIDELNRIKLSSSKASELKKQANELAIINAKEKGNNLAKAFGASLGKIYSINSNSENSRYQYGGKGTIVEQFNGSMITANKPNSYLQENITFSATINVVFDLEVE